MGTGVIHVLMVAALLLLAGNANAAVVDITASKDNTMFSEDGNLSNGAGNYIFAGVTALDDLRRASIAFDVAGSVPTNATINSATLILRLSKAAPASGNQTVTAHRALADWGEGASHATGQEGAGAPATSNDATWSHRLWNTTIWSSPGGDMNVIASASTSVDETVGTFFSWASAEMTADAQDMLDNSNSNHGWILLCNEAGTTNAKRFDSSESTTPANQPVLRIDYTVPAAVPAVNNWGAAVLVLLLAGISVWIGRTQRGGGIEPSSSSSPPETRWRS